MRQFRTYGSARGAARKGGPYRNRWIAGNAPAFGMCLKLYRHRDEFVVIDDVDALYADRNGVRLLRCLCQTEEEKNVA